MQQLWEQIYRWEHDLLNEQQKRELVATIIAIIATIAGVGWPTAPNPESDSLDALAYFVGQVKVLSGYSEAGV